jgi:putative two-component system response regulator
MTVQKILVVEDHKDSCLWISAVLRQCGYRPLEAGDGEMAVRIACRERPDLILLDMHLPLRGGEYVMESLKKHPACAKIPVIVMSGDTDLDEASLEEKGAVAVFRKPVDVHRFMHSVKEWVGRELPDLTPA